MKITAINSYKPMMASQPLKPEVKEVKSQAVQNNYATPNMGRDLVSFKGLADVTSARASIKSISTLVQESSQMKTLAKKIADVKTNPFDTHTLNQFVATWQKDAQDLSVNHGIAKINNIIAAVQSCCERQPYSTTEKVLKTSLLELGQDVRKVHAEFGRGAKTFDDAMEYMQGFPQKMVSVLNTTSDPGLAKHGFKQDEVNNIAHAIWGFVADCKESIPRMAQEFRN